jgi:hypothetical protein
VLGGEERGGIAGVLTSFAPAMRLFGVTSADYAFAGLGMVVACLLVRRAGWAVVPGGCAATVATFFSWLLFAIPASAALVVLQRDGWRAAARVCLAAGAGVIVFNAALSLDRGRVSARVHAWGDGADLVGVHAARLRGGGRSRAGKPTAASAHDLGRPRTGG